MTFNKTIYTFMLSFLFSLLMSISYASNYDPLVEILQRNLSLLNYKPGPTDGLWGRKTQQSYEEFLKDNKLPISKNPRSFSIEEVIEARLEKIKTNLVKRDHLKQPLNIRDAAHLLRRTGFGAHPYEVKQLLNETRAEGIIKILEGISTQGEFLPPEFMKKKSPLIFMENSINGYEKIMEMHRDQMQSWWVHRMITTSEPQLEKLTLFWHNHFVSSYEGTDRNNYILFLQNQKFREYGISNFKLLTKLMLSDSALLKYLDNDNNEKNAPNENLARELLELFTLGEGNYSEKTVRGAARTLTGYFVNKVNFFPYFSEEDHDFNEKTIFGKTANFSSSDLVDIIFEQPAASLFLTTKLWKLYISDLNLPNEELDSIAYKFRDSDFDLLVLISELLASKSFWNEKNRGTIIKSPVDLLIGSIRSTGYSTNSTQLLPEKLASLGQNLFEHPNVAGWPGGADWISSTRLLGRKQEINYFIRSFEKGSNIKMNIEVTAEKEDNNIYIQKDTPLKDKINRISLQDITYYRAKIKPNSFKSSSKSSGMNILLGSSKFKKHYNPYILFDLGYDLEKKEVNFCIKSPETISYFYENLTHSFFVFPNKNEPQLEFCYSSNLFKELEFLKILQTIDDDDIQRLMLVCKFFGSKERDDWFKSGKIQLGHEKVTKFWLDPQTIEKINALSKKCYRTINLHIDRYKNYTAVEKNKPKAEIYETDELVLDTARIVLVSSDQEDEDHLQIQLGLNDIIFNDLRKSAMKLEFHVNLKKKAINKRKFSINFRNNFCDNGCFTKNYTNPYNFKNTRILFPPSRNNKTSFFTLESKDQKFVAALWQALPELIDHAVKVSGSDIQEKYIPHLNEHYWKKELDDLRRMTLKSPYKKYVPNFKLTITEKTYPKGDTMNSMMTTNMTTPVSITLDQNIATKNKDDFLNKVEKLGIDIEKELSDLLLSINPVTNLSESERINALFEDPAFQLN